MGAILVEECGMQSSIYARIVEYHLQHDEQMIFVAGPGFEDTMVTGTMLPTFPGFIFSLPALHKLYYSILSARKSWKLLECSDL